VGAEGAAIEVEVRHDAGSAIVTLGGELEFGTAASLRSTFSDLVQQDCDRVVVDMAEVRFMDSSGLSLLVQAKQRFTAQGRGFELRSPTQRVIRVIETSGLGDLFAIHGHGVGTD
jgi:anti-sigma B factor antagonist